MEPTQQKSYYTIQNNCITSLGTKKDHAKIVKIVKTIVRASTDQRSELTKNLSWSDLRKIQSLYNQRFETWSLPKLVKTVLRYFTNIGDAQTILDNLVSAKRAPNRHWTESQPATAQNTPANLTKESLALPPELATIASNSSDQVKGHYESYNKYYAEAKSAEELANCKTSLELLYSRIVDYEADKLRTLVAKIPLTHGKALEFVQKKITEYKDLLPSIESDIKKSPDKQAEAIQYLKRIQEGVKKYALQIELLKAAQERNQNSNKDAHNQLQEEIVNADLNTLEQQKDNITQLLKSNTALTKEAVVAIFPPKTPFLPVQE
jgi:hypothetical protein